MKDVVFNYSLLQLLSALKSTARDSEVQLMRWIC